jgi:glyoxylase-like metal-dependent hydrolase (beta-lactamase superfamily II)/8-oxo-dGTP pyrophosphatase MutT (NUDIX family)
MTPPIETAVSVRSASTLVLLRDAPQGMEVLLLRRVERSGDRSSGAYVFPGGVLDAGDARHHACCAGLDDATASARLNVAANGLDHYVAAIRECFEEAGVLVACDAEGEPLALDAHDPALIAELRARLRRGETDLSALCARLGARLAAHSLAYYSHWLTPPGLPKRFDTRFFVAAMPPRQEVVPDRDETLEHCWLRPADALARAQELRLPNPTRRTLAALAGFASAADCIAHAQGLREIERTMPLLADGPRGMRPVHPDEPVYDEIERIDPHGAGHARYVIEPGRAVRLSPRVVRVTAPNPGVMTGPGTNSYLVGDPQRNEWAVIDPGPADGAHLQALLAAAPGPIRWILVTHTHRDHSPGAVALHERTGAVRLGMAAPDVPRHDRFVPDRTLHDGESLALGPGASLRAMHTPGHASNHLCFLLEQEKTLFSGDQIMQGSTVVIDPPDGDMGAYLASLETLRDADLDWIAPGHGFLIARPREAIARLIAHRRAREAKVLAALRELGPSPIERLLVHVYDDVAAPLHPVALRSLIAHLALLAHDGRARERDGIWHADDGRRSAP